MSDDQEPLDDQQLKAARAARLRREIFNGYVGDRRAIVRRRVDFGCDLEYLVAGSGINGDDALAPIDREDFRVILELSRTTSAEIVATALSMDVDNNLTSSVVAIADEVCGTVPDGSVPQGIGAQFAAIAEATRNLLYGLKYSKERGMSVAEAIEVSAKSIASALEQLAGSIADR
jgi:hypothetical protein